MATMSSTDPSEVGANPILRIIATISTFSGWVAAGMIVLAVIVTCEMIFVRFVLNHSTIWQTEAVVYLMVGATLIGLPFVQRMRGHVNVDLLPLMLPPWGRISLAIFTQLVTIVIVTLMLIYGYEYWHEAWSRNWKSDTVWGVRLWIPYAALPIGFGLFLLQMIGDFIGTITGIEKPFGITEN